MAAHSNILAWRVPWTEEHKESDVIEATEHTLTEMLWMKFYNVQDSPQNNIEDGEW